MNPYLSGIMALSQLSPEQFDMGMQRFQQIQQMQPQGLSALQARQAGLTADMNTTGQVSDLFHQKRINSLPGSNPSEQGVTTSFGPSSGKRFDRMIPQGPAYMNTTGRVTETGIPQGPAYTNTTGRQISQGPYSQPTMSPVSNVQGSFGTGAMPYTQPYYQRSFNPYSGGYGMGFGGGMPSYGGFGGGKGGGQPMYGGFGGGKGGRR